MYLVQFQKRKYVKVKEATLWNFRHFFFFFFTVYMWNAPSTMSSCEEVLAQDNMVTNLDDSEGQRGSLRTREEGFLLI